MCVCNCVFFCNVCVFLFSIFASFVTYNSTNLQSFFFSSHFPTWQSVTQKNNSWVHDFACFYWFHSLSLSLFLSLSTCSLIFSLFILETDWVLSSIAFLLRYWRHCRKTFVMFRAEENNRGRGEGKLEAGN